MKNPQALAEVVDKADAMVHASRLPIPDEIHKIALACGMASIAEKLKLLYVEETGENPWKH